MLVTFTLTYECVRLDINGKPVVSKSEFLGWRDVVRSAAIMSREVAAMGTC